MSATHHTNKGIGSFHKHSPFRLTAREVAIMTLVCDGWTREAICKHLSLRPDFYAQAVRHVREKFGCDTIEQAIAKFKNGQRD